MASPSSAYEPRHAAKRVLHRIVLEHFETFRAQAACLRDGEGLPWVLSLPYRLRYLLAWDHDLCRTVVGVYARARLGFLRRRARRDGVRDGRGGAVAIIQRFGGALNLNVHVHALVMDGVFSTTDGTVQFQPARRLTREDVAQVVAVVARRIERLLERRGVATAPEERGLPDAWSEDAPVLAGIAAASVLGRVALGPRAGARVQRYGERPDDPFEPEALSPCHAQAGGFDLHAAIVTRAGQRDRLERLCRYALRPPLAEDRLHVRTGVMVRSGVADARTDR